MSRAFNRYGTTGALALDIYPRLLIAFGMLVWFANLSLMDFSVRYLALFHLFSVINRLEWLWMGSLHKNIQLMLESLKAPFLALHFSYYMLINFLMMLSLTLLSMLIIPVTYSEVFWAYCYLQNKCS